MKNANPFDRPFGGPADADSVGGVDYRTKIERRGAGPVSITATEQTILFATAVDAGDGRITYSSGGFILPDAGLYRVDFSGALFRTGGNSKVRIRLQRDGGSGAWTNVYRADLGTFTAGGTTTGGIPGGGPSMADVGVPDAVAGEQLRFRAVSDAATDLENFGVFIRKVAT